MVHLEFSHCDFPCWFSQLVNRLFIQKVPICFPYHVPWSFHIKYIMVSLQISPQFLCNDPSWDIRSVPKVWPKCDRSTDHGFPGLGHCSATAVYQPHELAMCCISTPSVHPGCPHCKSGGFFVSVSFWLTQDVPARFTSGTPVRFIQDVPYYKPGGVFSSSSSRMSWAGSPQVNWLGSFRMFQSFPHLVHLGDTTTWFLCLNLIIRLVLCSISTLLWVSWFLFVDVGINVGVGISDVSIGFGLSLDTCQVGSIAVLYFTVCK